MQESNYDSGLDNGTNAEAPLVNSSKVSNRNFEETMQEERVIAESKEEFDTRGASEDTRLDNSPTLKSSKLQRSESKRSKESDIDQHKDHDNLEEEKKELEREKKELKRSKARLTALQDENEDLRSNNERLHKKLREYEAQTASFSPKNSKRIKELDVEKQKDRLRNRFERSESPSDADSSLRSSSKAPRSSRRMKHVSYVDRPYVEPVGPAAARPTVAIPTSPNVVSPGRRFDGPIAVSKTGQPAVSYYHEPTYSSTPRSAGMGRPTVFYKYDGAMSPITGYENGNYYPYPLDEGAQVKASVRDEEARRQDGVLANLETNSEAASGANVAMFELYETSSIQSYNDSLFDYLESELGSVSSLGDDTQAVFVGAFVDLLVRDTNVDRMVTRATSDSGIGAERLRASFNKILKRYSRDLQDTIGQQQQKEQKHERVAAFISRQTKRASSLLVMRYKERVPKSDNNAVDKVGQYLDGLESDNSDLSNGEEPDTEPTTIAGLETFLLQGKPFQNLKWHLRSLIIPNHHVTQVKASAENLLNFMFCDLGLEEAFARACMHLPDFNAWLSSKIDDLAASLETELKARLPVTEYLRIYSVYLSAQAVQKLRQKSDASYVHGFEPSCREQDNMHSTDLGPPQEILEDIMAEKLPEVFGGDFSQRTSWPGLISTKAFRDFFSDLSDSAYPTFITECRKAIKAELESGTSQPAAQSEAIYLLSILKELQWCLNRHGRGFSLSIESSDNILWSDRLKLAIEKSTGSEWSWWPLSPPPRFEAKTHVQLKLPDLRQQLSAATVLRPAITSALYIILVAALLGISFIVSQRDIRTRVANVGLFQRGIPVSTIAYIFYGVIAIMLFDIAANIMTPTTQHMRPGRSGSQEEHAEHAKVISWKCTCGSTRRELISPKYANLFHQLASDYPLAHYDNDPIQLNNRLSVPHTRSDSSMGDSTSSADMQSVNSSESTDEGSSRASVSTAPSSTGSTAITLEFDTQAIVHLLVRTADRYVLSPLNVTGKESRGFFRDLIVRYHQHRGFLRRVFSIFVYSHCDFVKVKHHRAHRFSPVPGFSFPELGRDTEYQEYTFSPKPMIQAPITKHMFNDYFYSCYDSHNLRHSLHKFLSSCDIIETLPQDLLENMPKRDREVVAGAHFMKVEHFWGIVAREQRSALRVVLYMLLSLMPTIWFTFMWLFSWGHDGDLQNATVPVMISIGTLSMVWAVVYSGDETRDK